MLTLGRYIRRWEINHPLIEGRKPMISSGQIPTGEEDEWHKLFPDQEIDGYSYKVLTTQDQLKQDTEQMKNCIFGFGPICHSGGAHVISAMTPKGERFTVDIRRDHPDAEYYLLQAVGLEGKKTTCPPGGKDAAQELVNAINEGRIEVNQNSGSVDERRTIEERLGFDYSNSEERESVFQSYQHPEVRALPKAWQKYKTAEVLVSEIGLDDKIENMIKLRLPEREITEKPNFPELWRYLLIKKLLKMKAKKDKNSKIFRTYGKSYFDQHLPVFQKGF